MVAPITRKADKRLNLAYTELWLPEGRWTDIFNGRVYKGGQRVRLYRDIDSIPVLAPAGAIIPAYSGENYNSISPELPIQLHLYRGDGSYTLYEDDGESRAFERGEAVKTEIRLQERGGRLKISLTPDSDYRRLVPEGKKFTLIFRDLKVEPIELILTDSQITLEVDATKPIGNAPISDLRCNILTRAQGSNTKKDRTYGKRMPGYIRSALRELDALWYD
jgi:hypothetical protein